MKKSFYKILFTSVVVSILSVLHATVAYDIFAFPLCLLAIAISTNRFNFLIIPASAGIEIESFIRTGTILRTTLFYLPAVLLLVYLRQQLAIGAITRSIIACEILLAVKLFLVEPLATGVCRPILENLLVITLNSLFTGITTYILIKRGRQ